MKAREQVAKAGGGGWSNGSTKFRLTALWYFSLQEKWRARADEIEDAIYVTMEILSNWGNASWVGLTEVQFFDLNDIKLYVSPHDVDIRNAVLPGKLGCLVNRDLVVSEGPGLGVCSLSIMRMQSQVGEARCHQP